MFNIEANYFEQTINLKAIYIHKIAAKSSRASVHTKFFSRYYFILIFVK